MDISAITQNIGRLHTIGTHIYSYVVHKTVVSCIEGYN